uniref:LRRCT domain-containing protein n=1 Tax=Stomoxys calcitrans TaxID=35570 RepID=A0A1I8Q8V1_STOCA
MKTISQHSETSMCGDIATLSLLLLLLLGLSDVLVVATNVDLITSCSKSRPSCLLYNITDSYEDPLKVSSFTALAGLQELVIRNSALRRIPKDLLEHAPHLKRLLMHNCGLNILTSRDFDSSQGLKVLNLQQNSIFTLTENVFRALRQTLEELYLRHNAIRILHYRAFAGLQKLKYLDANHNGINSLTAGMFDELINLEYMDLSYNQIEMIGSGTFGKNLKLSSIILSNNKFRVFEPNSFSHLPHLKLLDLSNTNLEDLHLQTVDFLQLSESGLKSCHLAGGVVRLMAANNSLKGLDITDKLSVQEIQMQGNLLESLDDFQGMLNLQKLDVSHNRLTRLKSSVEKFFYMELPNLEQLNMAWNHLRNLSNQDFLIMTKLSTLDLGNNHLFELAIESLEPLKSLHYLHIEGNHLMEFDVVNLKKSHALLQEISLGNNDWDEAYQQNISAKLQEQQIKALKERSSGATLNASLSKEVVLQIPLSSQYGEMQRLVGVSGIHPYWTLKDILALATLIIVLIILLLQFWNILQEEQCCRRSANRNAGDAEPLVHNNSAF